MDKKINTNCIIKQKEEKKQIYYIPGYLRVKVKNFTQMSLDDLSAQMNTTIIFTVYYGDLEEDIVEKLKTQIIFLFARNDAIKLKEDGNLEIKLSQNKQKNQIQFTIRKLLNLRIQSQVFWSPFQIINLILTITVQPVTVKNSIIKINLMDHQNSFIKLSYSDQGTFGNYDLAASLMRSRYSNERVYKIQDQQKYQKAGQKVFGNMKSKIQHFQYAHFKIPLYKYPFVAIATIFLPLFLLSIINLGIFFQTQNLSNRIQNLSALLISFVALIPTIRQQIPPNPKIVFIQILVYLSSLTSMLALIHSLDIRQITNFDLIWFQNGLFIVSAIITFGVTITVIIMMIIHYLFWLPSYKSNQQNKDKAVKFKRSQWKNIECDRYFEQWYHHKSILQSTLNNETRKSQSIIQNIINIKTEPLQVQKSKPNQ